MGPSCKRDENPEPAVEIVNVNDERQVVLTASL